MTIQVKQEDGSWLEGTPEIGDIYRELETIIDGDKMWVIKQMGDFPWMQSFGVCAIQICGHPPQCCVSVSSCQPSTLCSLLPLAGMVDYVTHDCA